ncbi:hypothetical protein [Kineococcus sp. SYSU DK004]|uniref:hypothetical protein n=1 Tax=Kineococcus sp. SYSU DK004 TaxID=3383125 RepID=UPI003D7CD62F
MDERARWREQRSEAALAHARAAERARQREHERARAMLRTFTADLRAAGVPPVPLRASAGRARYRTGLTGWYLKRDGSLGVAEDGSYHVLVVAPSVRALLLGVRVEPSDPPLQVGRGARDGESVELAELLRSRAAELLGAAGPAR